MPTVERCSHNGGQGIGAGHVCLCVRGKGHDLTDSPRPHGCSCGAIWADSATVAKPRVVADMQAAEARIDAAAKQIAKTYGRDDATVTTAKAALGAADRLMFSNEQLARIVNVTGLSLQTVSEVARELRRG